MCSNNAYVRYYHPKEEKNKQDILNKKYKSPVHF